MPKFIDLFGGIGGFRLGLEKTSDEYECVGYYDKNKYAVKSYNEIFNENHKPADVSEIPAEEFPDHDILCAGFPCQSFSIAGKRKGFEDTRGTLFFEIARIARQKLPKILFLENVKGLLNHSDGETFRKILKTLDELGYDAEWQVLNSKYHGVPQNRERVFIIGHLRGETSGQVFPFYGENEEDSGEDGGERSVVTHPTVSGAIGIAMCLDKNYFKGMDNRGQRTHVLEQIGYIPNYFEEDDPVVINHQMRPKSRPSLSEEGQSGGSGILFNGDYSDTLTGTPHYVMEYSAVLTPSRLNKRQNGRRMKEPGEPMFTLTGQDLHGVKVQNKIRKLTPRECWRLQGFPDWAFEKAKEVNSDTQLYKQAGNSVTVDVISLIGNRLMNTFIKDGG